MAYDEGLAERIREVLGERPDVSEKQMFGGIAFMLRGHMCVGIVKDDLMVRAGRTHTRSWFANRMLEGWTSPAGP